MLFWLSQLGYVDFHDDFIIGLKCLGVCAAD